MSETPPAKPVTPEDAIGHRERLRDRLLTDSGALQDYEVLEYLLAVARPRVDTKPTAKALIREFGSLGAVLSAKPAELARVKGVGDTSVAAIHVVREAAVRLLKAGALGRPILSGWQALLDYLQADMAHIGIERVRVLHLNTKNELVRDEVMAEGSIDQAPVYVREVMKRAMELKSSAIILVHNHPSGDPAPSKADIQLTRQMIEAGQHIGLSVHDHVIIGTRGHASLRALGLI